MGPYRARADVRRLLHDLCDEREFSLIELAALLSREPKYLRRHYLTPMIEAGELVYTEPEMPNHPRQAYRAATSDATDA